MLNIHTMTLGLYQTNCYIVHKEGSGNCIIIDPGYEANTILNRVALLGLQIEAILLTHAHFDHLGAVRQIAADSDCRVFVAEKELSLPPTMTDGPIFYTDLYPAEGVVSLAGMEIKVLPTPGHTPGSVCLRVEDALFSGDTLFAMSCGRTDLPGGSWKTIQQSLHRLASLEEDLRVYPGHGESTTLAMEKRYNPYMQ